MQAGPMRGLLAQSRGLRDAGGDAARCGADRSRRSWNGPDAKAALVRRDRCAGADERYHRFQHLGAGYFPADAGTAAGADVDRAIGTRRRIWSISAMSLAAGKPIRRDRGGAEIVADMGKVPLVMKKFIPGYIANRVQAAIGLETDRSDQRRLCPRRATSIRR